MIVNIRGERETNSVFLNGNLLTPYKSQKIINHSPTGFEWGYSGSGPAQLALAILLEITTLKRAIDNHQRFKAEVVARFSGNFNHDIDVKDYV